MHLGDGQHPAVGLVQRLLGFGRGRAVGLEVEEGRDELERVADAVVHLAHQHLPLGRQRFEPVAGFDDGAVGLLLVAAQHHAGHRRAHRGFEELDELAADVLDHVIRSARLERRDRDAALARAGDEDDRGCIGQGLDGVENVEPVAAGHVMVERHGVEAALRETREAGVAVAGGLDGMAEPAELALHEAAQRRIVVDVEEPMARHAQTCSGIWITDKNSPNCRIASAKL